MGRPIIEDENEIHDPKPAELEDNAVTATLSDAPENGHGAEATEGAPEYSAEDYEAILNEDRARSREGWIPGHRFKEVNENAKRLNEQNQQLIDTINRIAAAQQKPEPEKKRDLDAEARELTRKFKEGEIELDAYIDARDLIADARISERMIPVVRQLQQERQDLIVQRETAAMEQEAQKAYRKYPFLDVNSEEVNQAAVDAVIAERNELIRAGIPAAKALRLAVASVAPDFVGETGGAADPEDLSDEVALQRRRLAARRVTEAGNSAPPNIGRAGVGAKTAGGKIALSRSTEDFEKWDKSTPEERKRFIPYAG